MDEELIETKVKSETIYDGVLLHVRRDTVKLPNGNEAKREWIKHPGASSVIPIFPDGQIILVKQYRYPIEKITLEVPAGKLDSPDEDPLECAIRELSEETGYKSGNIYKLTTIATPLPGHRASGVCQAHGGGWAHYRCEIHYFHPDAGRAQEGMAQ